MPCKGPCPVSGKKEKGKVMGVHKKNITSVGHGVGYIRRMFAH